MYKFDALHSGHMSWARVTTRAHTLRVFLDQWLLNFFFGFSAGPHQSDAPIIIALDSMIPPLMSYSSTFCDLYSCIKQIIQVTDKWGGVIFATLALNR